MCSKQILLCLLFTVFTVASAQNDCDAGYTIFDGYCTKYVNQNKDWSAARSFCQNEEADLASARNEAEFDILYQVCQASDKKCWLGLSDSNSESNFQSYSPNSGRFVRWSSGQPDNSNNEDCVHYWDNRGATASANDISCSSNMHFLCMKKAGCPAGQYLSGGSCFNCPQGRFRDSINSGGVSNCHPCPAGRYGDRTGETSSSCSGSCARGYYCGAGSTSSQQNRCADGHYAASGGLATSSCSGKCAAGYYCSGIMFTATPLNQKCAAGRYGEKGATSQQCTGPCAAGYYCPLGSGSATATACGAVSKYCPEGSTSPQSVPSGSYSTPVDAPDSVRTGHSKCEAGFYCSGGQRFPCPAGKYGTKVGETNSQCEGSCQAGYYCPEGASSPTQKACGSGMSKPASVYCPAGSASPTTVTTGFYSTPLSLPQETRTSQQSCPSNSVCQDGIATPKVAFDSVCTTSTGYNRFSGSATIDEHAMGTTVATRSISISMTTLQSVSGSMSVSRPSGCAASWGRTVSRTEFRLDTQTDVSFEDCPYFDVTATVSSGGGAANTFVCDLRISVQDLNDRPTIQSGLTKLIAEDAQVDAPVGSPISGETVEEDTAQEVTFSITSGNTTLFDIGRCSGQLFLLLAELDYEGPRNQYPLTVRATDNGDPDKFHEVVVTVQVTNVNEPPKLLPAALTIDENSDGPTSPSSPPVFDSDNNEQLTWSIVVNDKDGVADKPVFDINPSTGALTVAEGATVDFEKKTSFRIEVMVEDDGDSNGDNKLSDRAFYTVTVIDKNDPPQMPEYTFTIREDAQEGDPVSGIMEATDPDGSSTISFSLTHPTFTLVELGSNSASIRLKTGASLDYESQKQYSLPVEVADNGRGPDPPASVTVDITVNVLDVNEQPEAPSNQMREVREDAFNGQGFGSPLECTDEDNDPPQDLFFELVSSADGVFDIGFNSGQLRVLRSAEVDYETKTSYTLRYKCIDNGNPSLSVERDFTVNVLEVNEAPWFPLQNLSIAENSAGGVNVGSPVSGEDYDAVDQNLFDYEIVGGSGQGLFTIVGSGPSQGQVKVANGADLNHEVTPELMLEVQVTDRVSDTGFLGTRQNATGWVHIDVEDIEEDPWFPTQVRAVREQKPASTNVGGKLQGRDEDAGQQANLQYEILATSSHTDKYTLSEDGQITLSQESVQVPNQEQYVNHTLTVRVTDSTGRTATGTVVVQVAGENFPPEMREESAIPVSEDSPISTLVHTAQVDDENPDQEHEWFVQRYIPSRAIDIIQLDRSTGELRLTGPLDYEDEEIREIALSVLVVDNGAVKMSDSGWLNVTVDDVNEAPTMDNSTMSIVENSEKDSVVSTVGISDEDAGESFSWSITALPGSETSNPLPFVIAESTGVISVREDGLLNYEETSVYYLQVTVTDSGPNTVVRPLTIRIIDENEPPVITPKTLNMDENQMDAGCVNVVDPDSGAHGKLDYTIVSGNTGGSFTVSSANDGGVCDLEVRARANAIDFEDIGEYTLRIRAEDTPASGSGFPVRSDERDITVIIGNVNDMLITTIDLGANSLFNTSGGQWIYFNGTDFGYTTRASTRNQQDLTVKGMYGYTFAGGSQQELPQTSMDSSACEVIVKNTYVRCMTGPGSGEMTWELRLEEFGHSAKTTASQSVRYAAPYVERVDGAAALSTRGGDRITITGVNFGPKIGFEVDQSLYEVRYGPSGTEFSARLCNVSVAHTEIECFGAPGNGTALQWTVKVNGLVSAPFIPAGSEMTSYGPPAITSIDEPRVMSTRGDDTIVVRGVNLGQVGSPVTATYGRRYSVECTVETEETVECPTAEGTGKDHTWELTVAGQTSESSGDTTRYKSPVLRGVGGEGATAADSRGGQRVVINGGEFGPPRTLPPESDVLVEYGPGGSKYVAVKCNVTSHSTIECLTAPGVGFNHSWHVTVDGQSSNVLHAGTSYSAPILTGFEGPGYSSDTRGDERVDILGLHFGPPGTEQIDYVEYTDGVFVFPATGCVVVSHTKLSCNTSEGVGDGLVWTAFIAGQRSKAPATSYERPLITGFRTANGRAPSTKGGELVYVYGTNFGPKAGATPTQTSEAEPYPEFLEWVRYGPTGLEYDANCTVLNHTTMLCVTSPGSGTGLVWKSRVEGQTGDISTATFDYARPSITSISPASAQTDGGILVEVEGTNFGLEDPNAEVFIRWRGEKMLNTTEPKVIGTSPDGNPLHRVKFRLPQGVGLENSFELVQVLSYDEQGTNNVVRSPPFNFAYDPPVINNAYPAADRSGVGLMMVIVGRNFGPSAASGFVEITLDVNGQVLLWTHSRIEVELLQNVPEGVVRLFVQNETVDGSVTYWEESYSFRFFTPTLSARAGDQVNVPLHTEGGEVIRFEAREVGSPNQTTVYVGRDDCPAYPSIPKDNVCDFLPGYPRLADNSSDSDNKTFEVACRVPPGMGRDNLLTIQFVEALSPSSVRVHYLPPSVTHFTPFSDFGRNVSRRDSPAVNNIRIRIPTTGGLYRMHGRDFGLIGSFELRQIGAGYFVHDDALNSDVLDLPPVLPHTHRRTGIDIPPGVGVGHELTYLTGTRTHGNCDDPFRRLTHNARASAESFLPPLQRVFVDFEPPSLDVQHLLSPTKGGVVLRINGSNFGASDEFPTIPKVSIGGKPCPVLRDGSGGYLVSHDFVLCEAPEGSGANLSVTLEVGGQSAPVHAGAVVSYYPPRVHSVSPNHAGTEGGAFITVRGENFGDDPSLATIELVPESTSNDPALDPRVLVPNVDIISYTHEEVVFKLPRGFGEEKMVVVTVNGQMSLADPSQSPGSYRFLYDPPVLQSVDPLVCPTRGCVMTLRGENFGHFKIGKPLARVFVDALPTPGECKIDPVLGAQDHTDDAIRCTMPDGVGASRDIRVRIGKRTSNTLKFSYEPPIIESIIPNVVEALGGQTIEVRGRNFGPNNATMPKNVWIDGVACRNVAMPVPHTTVKCVVQQTTVGHKDVKVFLALQNSTFRGSNPVSRKLSASCPTGYYGQTGEFCSACPQGSGGLINDSGLLSISRGRDFCQVDPSCRQAVLDDDQLCAEPVSIPGYWRLQTNTTGDSDDRSTAQERCQEFTQGRDWTTLDSMCSYFVPCEPSDACVGNNKCNEENGYTGERCLECKEGFYRLDGECESCPANAWVLFVVVILAAIFLGVAGYILNSKHVHLALVSIGVDYFQVLAIFARSKVAWPTSVRTVLRWLSIFMIDPDVTAPECSFNVSFEMKWYITMLMPLIVIALFGTLVLAKYLYKRCVKRVSSDRRWSHAPMIIGVYFTLFYFMYLLLARGTFDVFNCAPHGEGDGYEPGYLVRDPAIPCFKDGGTHWKLFYAALATLIVYVIAYPVIVVTILWKNKELVKIDQLLRALDKEPHAKEQRDVYVFRKKFRKLYYHFLPGKWYWIFFIIARKFLIAVTALLFQKTPSFQLAMALMVLIGCYALQVRNQPYMSMSQRADVIIVHNRKVTAGDPLHVKLDSDIRKAAVMRRHRGVRMDMSGVQRAQQRNAADYAWDYNTVESIFLFCAVLVSLSGVMFEANNSEWQREMLGVLVILLIVGSLMYYMFVLVTELMTALCPKAVSRLPCFKNSATKSTLQLEEEAMMKKKARKSLNVSDLTLNPYVLHNLSNVKLSNADVEEVMQILEQPKPPDLGKWVTVRNYLKRLGVDIDTLSKELTDLKRKELLVKSAAANSKRVVARQANRKQFGQMQASKGGMKLGEDSDVEGNVSSNLGFSNAFKASKSGRMAEMRRKLSKGRRKKF